MSAELKSRISVRSTDDFGGTGRVTESIILGRDVNALDLNLKKTGAKDYQQILLTNTLAATTGATISLNDAANTTKDASGAPLQIATLFWFYLEVVTPAAGHPVRFGPQGVTNAAQLWFHGTGANDWIEVPDCLVLPNRAGGWAVASGTPNVRLYNPHATDAITVRMWLLGEKP